MAEPILAYHITQGEEGAHVGDDWHDLDALREVLEEGYIAPALERVDPQRFEEDCRRQIDDVVASLWKHAVPATVDAIREFAEREIKSLEEFQYQHGLGPRETPRPTKINCWDFLAEDIENVFLSAYDWPWIPDDGATGLVFNAEDLVRMGARVRRHDFMPDYTLAVEKILQQRFPSPEDAQMALREAFAKIQRGELIGERALRFLRRGPRTTSYNQIELVWGGPLDVSWAVEVWEMGKVSDIGVDRPGPV